MAKQQLDVASMCEEVKGFAPVFSSKPRSNFYKEDRPKKVGTCLEVEFKEYLEAKYEFNLGSSSKGIDFPSIKVDVKVTKSAKPQSSCRYSSPNQKIFGMGFHILVFLYSKRLDEDEEVAYLHIDKVIFIRMDRTSDHKLTGILRKHVEEDGNEDDIVGVLQDKQPWLTDDEARGIAKRVLGNSLCQGYVGVSNAPQWRLRYANAVKVADGSVSGVERIV